MQEDYRRNIGSTALLGVVAGVCLAVAGCRSPAEFREQADKAASGILDEAQRKVLGKSQPLQVEPAADELRRRLLLDQKLPQSDPASLGSADVKRIPQWPDQGYGPKAVSTNAAGTNAVPMRLTLADVLQIAARSSRQYQMQKEEVFLAALALDLQRDGFRNTWNGLLESEISTDGSGDSQVSGVESRGGLGVTRKLKSGGTFAANLGLDLARLLTQDRKSAFGIVADVTATIPLMRGAGKFVVTEPLTQAERNVVYAIYALERFKRTMAVDVASKYLGVLQQQDQMNNARDSYKRLILSSRRAGRLADAGQLPAIQVDQTRQDELRARNRWISAQLAYEGQLDAFKGFLGLPPDSRLDLDRAELETQSARVKELAERGGREAQAGAAKEQRSDNVELREPARAGGGALEIEPEAGVRLALRNRLDLRTQIGKVFDSQRSVAVAADQLRADVSLLGGGSAGESRSLSTASSGNGQINLSEGRYSAGLKLDLPLERTKERNLYRARLIEFEKAVRAVQELEDGIKLQVRDELRALFENREAAVIQAAAVEIARRRLASTTMFLEAGRAQVRDVLEAEESLILAQNALSAAMVNYRVGELELQRDMDVLKVDESGLWHEYAPPSGGNGER
jgi:outer membrane protein TolC